MIFHHSNIKLKNHVKYYSTTVNLFENFKPENLIPLKESHIKIFMNITKATHQNVVEFIQSNLIDIIKLNPNNEKLFVKLHILAGKPSKLILSETDKTYMKEDIDSLNKILSRLNYYARDSKKFRNRDPLTLIYDVRGMALTVKRLSYAIVNVVDADTIYYDNNFQTEREQFTIITDYISRGYKPKLHNK